MFFTRGEFEPEVQAIIDRAMEVAISPAEMRYADGFYIARSMVSEENVDPETALADIEQRISDLLVEARERQSVTITVAQPESRRELAAGEVVLNFGMNSSGIVSARRQQWEDAVSAFTQANPTIADVDLDTNMYGLDGQMDTEIDCWYNSFGSSFSGVTEAPEEWLALDPLLNVDPNFNPDDFLPGVLESVQIGGTVYGYPVTVQPVVMWINPTRFEEAGLPVPEGSWTLSAFNDALVTLASLREDTDMPVVRSDLYGSTGMMMLIASYGGLPIDYNTDPPTYNLMEAQNLAAIEQVVAYARDGLIDYSGLLSNSSTFFGGIPDNDLIVIDVLGDQSFRLQTQEQLNEYPLQPITFPSGIYTPVAYSVGMAQIMSASLNIQPCYDWIISITENPELLTGMPAQQSALENPALIAQYGEDIVAFYRELTTSLTAPDTVLMPNIYGGVPSTTQGAWIEPAFFYKALDNAILEDADLETELTRAEENIAMFRECSSGIEQLTQEEVTALYEDDQEAGFAYIRQFVDCAVTILPELRNQYSYYYQDDE
ncbi:MAG: hypothetical protein RLP44_22595 [Aggregatilineales bacterium]